MWIKTYLLIHFHHAIYATFSESSAIVNFLMCFKEIRCFKQICFLKWFWGLLLELKHPTFSSDSQVYFRVVCFWFCHAFGRFQRPISISDSSYKQRTSLPASSLWGTDSPLKKCMGSASEMVPSPQVRRKQVKINIDFLLEKCHSVCGHYYSEGGGQSL